MSGYNDWLSNLKKESTIQSTISPSWTPKSTPTPRSSSPLPSNGEDIYNKYIDIINSKSNVNLIDGEEEPPEHPFDFFDDEEFAFGISLLNNNVACVGDNITKLVQMETVSMQQPVQSVVEKSSNASYSVINFTDPIVRATINANVNNMQ